MAALRAVGRGGQRLEAAIGQNPVDSRLVGHASESMERAGASIGGRPHHRIGDRYQDLKELGGNAV